MKKLRSTKIRNKCNNLIKSVAIMNNERKIKLNQSLIMQMLQFRCIEDSPVVFFIQTVTMKHVSLNIISEYTYRFFSFSAFENRHTRVYR
jgi:hypothetical protein